MSMCPKREIWPEGLDFNERPSTARRHGITNGQRAVDA